MKDPNNIPTAKGNANALTNAKIIACFYFPSIIMRPPHQRLKAALLEHQPERNRNHNRNHFLSTNQSTTAITRGSSRARAQPLSLLEHKPEHNRNHPRQDQGASWQAKGANSDLRQVAPAPAPSC